LCQGHGLEQSNLQPNTTIQLIQILVFISLALFVLSIEFPDFISLCYPSWHLIIGKYNSLTALLMVMVTMAIFASSKPSVADSLRADVNSMSVINDKKQKEPTHVGP
jgi:hypothetical protein